jgi:hypothetical protein
VGRPGAPIYPAELGSGERDCLNCGDPFIPAATGWQALYCSHACWRANNGGPQRHRIAYRPRPVEVVPLPDVPAPPPAGGSFQPPAATPVPVAAGPFPPHQQPPPPPSRLVGVGLQHCPRCGVDHQVYGLRGAL